MSALFRTATTDFDRLYSRHAASVYRYAYAVLGNHADAEDVAQQTFLKAYQALAGGTKPRKAENWLLTITHNEVRRHLRERRGKAVEVELDDQLAQPPAEQLEPSFADVVRALQHLPAAQRSALVMREFEGRSYSEIAEVMGVTQSALEALIFRARRSLAQQLEEALTCAQAEAALSRRLDGRLSRRESRRLKEHLRECPTCERFERVQKRQRSLLRGVSVLFPFPASLFNFRGEEAAVAGAAGGSAAASTGIAGGLAFKAAAVTAAAAVAGGAGYEVATTVDRGPTASPAAMRAAVAAVPPTPSRAVQIRGRRSAAGVPTSVGPTKVKHAKKVEAGRSASAPHGKALGRQAKAAGTTVGALKKAAEEAAPGHTGRREQGGGQGQDAAQGREEARSSPPEAFHSSEAEARQAGREADAAGPDGRPGGTAQLGRQRRRRRTRRLSAP